MLNYIVVMFGGALGAGARFWASGLVAHQIGEFFPVGTLAVCVTGSFIIGSFTALTGIEGRFLVPTGVRQFLMIGVHGGYAALSLFSLQTLGLARDGNWLNAGSNAVLSLVCYVGRICVFMFCPK
jgi:CrcB protein